MCRIPQLVATAKEMGMDSLAITDHGYMYGNIEFYLTAREAGIKPIMGCEVYVAEDMRTNRKTGEKTHYHLLLLAKNQTGYRNLIQLTTKANLEGYYYKPRVDKELLQQHNEGLIALSACMGAELPQLIISGRIEDARQSAMWYKQNFEDYYLEIQRHPIPELEQVNGELIKMSAELDIPLVATNDVHYINKDDASIHELLLCIQTNSTIQDEKRMKMAGDFFYLKSPQEMAELFKDIPQAIENTGRIAEMCNLELEFGRLYLPEIDLPEEKTADEFLTDLCYEGLQKQYPNATQEIKDRLEYELDVIKKTEFANYFLVVWDIISFTKEKSILYGVRGSAAASIVLHCLGITAADPIEHQLVFERFLNLERKEMPDIDLDFEDERRDEVISYVSQRYGQDHVAQIITFGTLGARAAIRDMGRSLGLSYGDVDRVAKLVPFGPGMSLDRAMEENTELRDIYNQDSIIKNLVDTAKRVEGIARHASTHAAGIVISKEPLTRYVPLQQASRNDVQDSAMTQFSMEYIAKIGLLKMDFLGLANLSILGKAVRIIKQNKGVDIDLQQIPMEDAKTFELLSSGETSGVFQLEGAGMRRYIKDLKPTCFNDIAAMVALYRPGPMDHIPRFINSKHGIEPITYPHPALASILEETYGVIVYQDQVLFIVRTFAGYSLGQADIFRKAMGKKIPEVMQKERLNFVKGAEKNQYSTELAEEIFALIEPFAGYAFNKAHSVSYALIAYQTANLKANYPSEYMTAFLMTNSDQSDKVSNAINECRRLGISVLPPDINKSQASFSIEDSDSEEIPAIRFGLATIKNVGAGAVDPVIVEREKNGLYQSIEDLSRRADLSNVNRRVLESLIKAGALDSMGKRGALLQCADRMLSMSQQEQRLKESGQSTMFNLWGETTPVPLPSIDLPDDEISTKEKLTWEKELMGVYLSEHPFSPYASKEVPQDVIFCGQIDAELVGQTVRVAGMVASVSPMLTRAGKPFASAVLEDLDGSVNVMIWPKIHEETKELWIEGDILLVEGKIKLRDDKVQLNCDRVTHYQPETIKEEKINISTTDNVFNVATPAIRQVSDTNRLIINISQSEDEEADKAVFHKLIDILKDFPGEDEVRLRVINKDKVYNLKMPHIYINYCPELHNKLAEVVGDSGIKLMTSNTV